MKKLLLIIIVVLLVPFLAAFALWLYGMRSEAGHTGAAIEVSRPAAAVWPYVSRPELLKKWIAGLEDVSPANAPLVKGTRTTVMSRGRPEETPFSMEQVLTLVDAPKRLGFTLTAVQQGMGFEQKVEYRLEERTSGTRVSVVSQSGYTGFVKLLEPFITSQAQDKLENDLRRLKSVVESETARMPMPVAQSAPPEGSDTEPNTEPSMEPNTEPTTEPSGPVRPVEAKAADEPSPEAEPPAPNPEPTTAPMSPAVVPAAAEAPAPAVEPAAAKEAGEPAAPAVEVTPAEEAPAP